jgi:methylmalonyl-CoA/ethylmalonyl-CoA epimerase
MAEAVQLFHDALGGHFLNGGDNDDTGIRLAHFTFAGFKVELMQPLHADSVLAETIRRRGPGFHHLTFMVDDVATTEHYLHARGLPTTGTDISSANWSETFLRPAATFGALLQFVSSKLRWDLPNDAISLDDVLAGNVIWRDYVACVRSGG